ncbi:collagen alpha-4(VI) chain-like [Ornithorhynchus anatinus]|uniref:collagen alpha-4(VI) chain-like n=1 Tax=Ornithorhynchus anatinus TaxID=9258 RepID=UPI0010A854EE|nr:collagen alpha-4(VI) chain-like [Ornithorhynchus anatinus]
MDTWQPLFWAFFSAAAFYPLRAQKTASFKPYADVVFLVDASEKLELNNFPLIKNFIFRIIRTLEVGSNRYQIGLAQFSGTGHVEFLLNTYLTKAEMIDYVQQGFTLRHGPRRTGNALQFLQKTFFKEAAGSRFGQGVPQYAVVITSGKSEDAVAGAARKLRGKGVNILSVGIQNFDKKELETMASPSLVFKIQREEGASQLERKVIDLFRSSIKKRDNTEEEKGTMPGCLRATVADIVFLVEESSNIGQSGTQQIGNILRETVKSLVIGPDNVRIGLVLYSDEPRLVFSLETFQTKESIMSHLAKLPYRGGKPKTGAALKFLRENIFTQDGNRRYEKRVQRMAVVITEGFSEDRVSKPASQLRRAGVTIYALGIQRGLERGNLEKMASYPPRKHVMKLDLFQDHSYTGRRIGKLLCTDDLLQPSVVVLNNALKRGCRDTEKVDIYFLIDGSSSIDHGDFLDMKMFMSEVLSVFQMGNNRVRFGVVQYSDSPHLEFEVGQYHSTVKLKEAIRGIKQLRGRDRIGEALNYMNQRFMDNDRVKILILITAGNFQDQVAESAQELRQRGIVIYAIGVKTDNQLKLISIAGTEENVLCVNDFDTLKHIKDEVVQDICFPGACKNMKADIIFLIDGSESIKESNFEKMKEFMKLMVNMSNIGPENVRIGVLQFSSSPREEFMLNKYTTKEDLSRAISDIKQIKAGTQTGQALTFTLPYFDTSRWGRPTEPQYLIVITDGEAQDSVKGPAKALRDKGISIFAIGVLEANKTQLLEITGTEDQVFYENDFDSLIFLKKKISFKLCIPKDSEGCSIDITVAVDITRPSEPVQQKLREVLPSLLRELASFSNISCRDDNQITVRFRYLVPAPNGQLLFNSESKEYDEEIIQKFLAQQYKFNQYMNSGFLRSLGEASTNQNSAKVKVLLVFTDGLDDDFEKLKETSMSLQFKAFDALLAVGLEGVQKLEELQEIEFGRGYYYKQPLSIKMQGLSRILLKQLDSVAERECCGLLGKCVGEDGFRGPYGQPGRKGLTGPSGMVGYPGEEGDTGGRGSTGLPGHRGDTGCPGPRGPKGLRGHGGEKGSKGDDGINGVDGEQGESGTPGSHGEKGSTGKRGWKGPPGELGDPGVPGFRGDPGDPGTSSEIQGQKGEKGRRGRQGNPGRVGLREETGNRGPVGARGQRGQPGVRGLRGEFGREGSKGLLGFQGSQGPRGYQGSKGTAGLQGLPGPQGAPGSPGAPGLKGNMGRRGFKGDHGELGERGPLGPAGSRGMPGLPGKEGYGHQGRKGAKGEYGFPGFPGLQGEDGVPGYPGKKGSKGVRGRRHSAGYPGLGGVPGDLGPPGPMGIKGPKGVMSMTLCEMVSFTRFNCPCSSDTPRCPVFPTEVVFALDMSEGVTPSDFKRMTDILSSLLERMNISGNNCPTGARVAIVSYNDNTRYLLRFSDFQKKNLLLDAVRQIPLKHSSGSRNVGRAMLFVARNVFKRARAGILMRKVAIFFATGLSNDASSINTATLELSAQGITPAVIAFSDVPNVRRAFEMDDSEQFKLFLWESEEEQDLERLTSCTLCYDPCNAEQDCKAHSLSPIPVNMDIAYVVDGSQGIRSETFNSVKHFVSTLLDQFVIAPSQTSNTGARVALVQYAPPGFFSHEYIPPAKKEFDFYTFHNGPQMKRHIQMSFQQLKGPPAIAHTLEWTMEQVFLPAPSPKRNKVFFIILGSETSAWDRSILRKVSLDARCKGYILFTVALDRHISIGELAELSSSPLEQHLLRLDDVLDLDMPYARRFIRAFLNLLRSEINPYPPPELFKECEEQNRGDNKKHLNTKRFSFKGSDYMERLEALERRKSFVGVNSTAKKLTTPQEEDNYFEDNKYAPEENRKEHPEKTSGNADVCSMAQDRGECQDYILKWFYNSEQKSCMQFWYGGCGGNPNRFETQQECESRCVEQSLG